MQPRIGFAAQIVVGVQQNLKESRQVFFAERGRSMRQARALIGGRGNQIGIGSANPRDQKIAEMADGFAAKMLQILSFGEQPMHQRQDALGGTRLRWRRQVRPGFPPGTTPSSSRTCASVMFAPQ